MTITGFRAWIVLIVMILSLCLNSFFVGAIITRSADVRAGNGGQVQPGREMVAIAGFQRLFQGLPEETRNYLRSAFDANAAEIMPAFRQLREARLAVLDAIDDEDFSASGLESAFADVRQRTDRLQQVLHATFVATVAAMPETLRAEMVEIWRSRQ